MKKRWIVGLVMIAAPFWAGAAEMDKMGKEDMDKMDKPAATATPVTKAKPTKKKAKNKKEATTKGSAMNIGKSEAGTAKTNGLAVSAKKEHWAGACPKCGMALVLEKEDSKSLLSKNGR